MIDPDGSISAPKPESRRLTRAQLIALALILATSAAVRLVELGRASFWYDEIVTIRLARSAPSLGLDPPPRSDRRHPSPRSIPSCSRAGSASSVRRVLGAGIERPLRVRHRRLDLRHRPTRLRLAQRPLGRLAGGDQPALDPVFPRNQDVRLAHLPHVPRLVAALRIPPLRDGRRPTGFRSRPRGDGVLPPARDLDDRHARHRLPVRSIALETPADRGSGDLLRGLRRGPPVVGTLSGPSAGIGGRPPRCQIPRRPADRLYGRRQPNPHPGSFSDFPWPLFHEADRVGHPSAESDGPSRRSRDRSPVVDLARRPSDRPLCILPDRTPDFRPATLHALRRGRRI